MANKIITCKGNVKYAKVFEHNRDMGERDNDASRTIAAVGGRYMVDFYPYDAVEWVGKLTDVGAALVVMGYPVVREAEGLSYTKLKRDHNAKTNRTTGEAMTDFAGAPTVVDEDGQAWDESILLGNDTEVEIAVDVWFRAGKKTDGNLRLRAIRVLELVEWDGETPSSDLPDWLK